MSAKCRRISPDLKQFPRGCRDQRPMGDALSLARCDSWRYGNPGVFVTNAWDRYTNRAQPKRPSSIASAKSKRDPGPGRIASLSMVFAVMRKRAAAIATIAVPRKISARPASLPNLWPGTDRLRPAREGAASSRNKSNRSTRNPNAMTAMAVRTQARKVRSFAEWSAKFRIILSPPGGH